MQPDVAVRYEIEVEPDVAVRLGGRANVAYYRVRYRRPGAAVWRKFLAELVDRGAPSEADWQRYVAAHEAESG